MQIPVVIEGPVAVVTAAEAKAAKVFSADDGDDAYINMLLAVAQSQIDGSDGSLGRAIGLQTLEITVPAWCTVDTSRLPLPNYVETVSDTLSGDGQSRAFRWKAGYANAAAVPAGIKYAIILMAGALKDAMPSEGGDVKRKTVDGVGSFDYTLPDGAADTMTSAAKSLLDLYAVKRV